MLIKRVYNYQFSPQNEIAVIGFYPVPDYLKDRLLDR